MVLEGGDCIILWLLCPDYEAWLLTSYGKMIIVGEEVFRNKNIIWT